MSKQKLHPIPKRWLQARLFEGDSDFAYWRIRFDQLWQDGDELWSYDEPAPPGVNAGELGMALVRAGKPIHAIMTGIH